MWEATKFQNLSFIGRLLPVATELFCPIPYQPILTCASALCAIHSDADGLLLLDILHISVDGAAFYSDLLLQPSSS